MPRYDYVLFDADNTLYDFDRAEQEALRKVFKRRGYPTGPEVIEQYLAINRGLWARFDRGEVRQDWLVVERFAAFVRAMGGTDDPAEFNREYLTCLGEGAYLLPGAEELCRKLAGPCTLAIVTNGVALAQRSRFQASPLSAVIPWLFISEEVGAGKPDPAFFRAVFREMGIRDPGRVLMVGDNLLTDIQGGLSAGVDTAWYNVSHRPAAGGIVPTYEVASYQELETLILG